MENEIDLTGVDPARWPEIRRRVEILDEYVAIWRPTADVRQEFSARLGVAQSHLMYLARIWRQSRNASILPGARAKNKVATPRRIAPRAFEVARSVIRELGPIARRKDILQNVKLRCLQEGLDSPSNSTVA